MLGWIQAAMQQNTIFEFGNPKITVHKGAETIQGRKLSKGGNYMRKYGMYLAFTLQMSSDIACDHWKSTLHGLGMST